VLREQHCESRDPQLDNVMEPGSQDPRKGLFLRPEEWLLPRRRSDDDSQLPEDLARRESTLYRYVLVVLTVLLAPVNVHNLVVDSWVPALAGFSLLLLFIISIHRLSRRRSPLLPPAIAIGLSIAVMLLSIYYGQTYQLYWLYPLLVALPVLLQLRIAVWLGLACGLVATPLIFQQFEFNTAVMISLSMAHTWLISGGMMYAATEHNRRLNLLVSIDPLTGVQNRRHLPAELERQWQGWQREQRPSTLLMLDIDNFKQLNDTYGHASGDAVLCTVAAILRRRLRAGDHCYRYGGEEFLIVLSGTPLPQGILVAEELRRQIELAPPDECGEVTVSAGVCGIAQCATLERWLDLADRALYRAKAAGRNRVVAADESDGAQESPPPR